jgi:predicted glycoside hydrolase/deacetylase ChbG (UPF0249 family)
MKDDGDEDSEAMSTPRVGPNVYPLLAKSAREFAEKLRYIRSKDAKALRAQFHAIASLFESWTDSKPSEPDRKKLFDEFEEATKKADRLLDP